MKAIKILTGICFILCCHIAFSQPTAKSKIKSRKIYSREISDSTDSESDSVDITVHLYDLKTKSPLTYSQVILFKNERLIMFKGTEISNHTSFRLPKTNEPIKIQVSSPGYYNIISKASMGKNYRVKLYISKDPELQPAQY